MNESFTYYKSFYEGLQDLDDATYRRLNDALMRYALFGEEPELTGTEKTAFISWKANIDASNRRKTNGAKGGRPAKESMVSDKKTIVFDAESMVSDSESMVSEEKPNITITEKETIKETIKDKEKRTRFVAPSLDEVKDYCHERGNNIDPETFIDFYAAKGWKVGNQPMKDWKACVRTWEKRDRGRASPKEEKGKFDDIAAQLVRESMGDIYGGDG